MAEPLPVQEAPAQAAQPGVRTPDGGVAFVDKEGAVQSIPAENAQAALQEGYHPATAAEYEAARDGAMGTVRAGVYGAARGASFGAFDPIAAKAAGLVYGDEGEALARTELNRAREGHQTANLVGEIGGSLLPLAFGAPGGAAAETVAGESFLARAGARALSAVPRSALEGAAMGLGAQLSEDTLGNHDLVAQKYLSSALKGGILGTIMGAGLHAAGGAVGDALANRLARAGEAAGEGVATKSVSSRLASFAEEQAAKGAMPSASLSAGELQKLGRTAEEQMARTRRIGRALIDEGISTPTATKGMQAERLTKRVAEVGEELGELRRSLEKSAIRPSAENIMKRMESEVLGPLMQRPFSQAEQASVRPFVQELTQRLGVTVNDLGETVFKSPNVESFETLHKLRVALDKKLDPKLWQKLPGTAPAGFEELGHIRGILEDEFEKAADLAARDLGTSAGEAYRVKKALFADLKTAEKWATKGAARDAQNQAFSLTDVIAAGSGMASGHLGLGLLAPIANKIRRTYGNQVAAAVADRASKLEMLQRGAAAFDAKLTTSVEGFFSGKKGGTKRLPAPKMSPEELRTLRAAVKDPSALTERVAQNMRDSGIADAAPKVAQAMQNTMMRAAAHLQRTLPPEPPNPGFKFGPTKPMPLGPMEQAKVEATIGALDMDGILDDLHDGRVDHMKIQALRIINPEGHQAIIRALDEYGQKHAAELGYQQQVTMSIITGRPIGQLMQPGTMRGFQKALTAGQPPDPSTKGTAIQPFGSAPTPPSGPSKTARALSSGTDRMESES